MVKVLVFGMTANMGGVESFLMNYYRHIDKSKVHFDFLCNSMLPCAYEDELIKSGSIVYHITARSHNLVRYHHELEKLFQNHHSEYDAIWVNVNSLANIDYLIMAKKYQIPRRIIHSHNSQNMDSRLRGILHQYNKNKIDRYATDFWACSDGAARWFYRDELMPQVHIVHNAINIHEKKFDFQKRSTIRNNLGLKDSDICIGNIGRLHFQKNQKFALQVFAEYNKINPASRLVFVGQGQDEKMLKEMCHKLGIADRVIFAGLQKDIQAWLSAFDIFLFPSLFEGLSIAALEAQANGVPILASETAVSQELRIADNLRLLSLEETPEQWAQSLNEISHSMKRTSYELVKERFVAAEYEINAEANKLEKAFLEEV